jgi:hypothetical protein
MQPYPGPSVSGKGERSFPAGKIAGRFIGTAGSSCFFIVATVPNIQIRIMENGVPVLSGDPE